ncbi:restriction endonuclease subunit S [Pseudoalteromonas sp. P1-25]|uniref:restriction endonuclease subunit S n=1 Tax=Pseudoalteromonas sp. P1-25 TaxID=1723758 RepID=UPI0006D67F03|nr:restriction endonuclease subunit S [Pseudoalteromonas sp. P1-25]KPZ57974.1 Type-1 restriction enzyme EcoKI specificity protein [Pseudoalteromonas sp. P1-25]
MSFNTPKHWKWQTFESLLSEPLRNGIYKKKEFHGSGAKIVNMGELFKYPRLKEGVDMKRVELTEKELIKATLKQGDLIFARRSLTAEGAGKCSIILAIDEPTTFESSIIRARLNSQVAVPEFYYYLFNSPFGKWLLGTILRQVAVSGITGSDLARLNVPVPPIEEQQEIIKCFGNIDDKIETNCHINQSLENIAQAIFKSWFADFEPVKAKIAAREAIIAEYQEQSGKAPSPQEVAEVETQAAIVAIAGAGDIIPTEKLHTLADLFPNQLVESELGQIPEGWELKKVEEIVTRLKPKQRFTKKQVEPHGNVPVYEQGAGILLGYQNGEAGFKATPESPIFIFGDHTCVTHLSCEPFDISSNVIPLKGCDFPTIWVFQAIKDLQKFQEYRRHWSEFIIKQVFTPSFELAEFYSDLATTLAKQKEANVAENSTLIQIRDVILPQLLSGNLKL